MAACPFGREVLRSFGRRRDDDVVDRLDAHPGRVRVADGLREEAAGCREPVDAAGFGAAPAPDGHTERRRALDLVAAVVARALRVEVVTHEVDARELVIAAASYGLPPRERPRAVECYVGEAAS